MRNKIVIFDLNGVLLAFSVIDFIRSFFSYRKKWRLLAQLSRPDRAWYALWYAIHEPVVESGVLQLLKRYPELEQHRDYMLNAINCQRIKKGAIELLKLLKKNSIPCYALTNIGEESIKRLQHVYPEFFGYFHDVFYTTATTGYLCKPDKRYFKQQLAHIPPTTMQFYVDDNKKNIKTAHELGMKAILFSTIPSLQQIFFKEIL